MVDGLGRGRQGQIWFAVGGTDELQGQVAGRLRERLAPERDVIEAPLTTDNPWAALEAARSQGGRGSLVIGRFPAGAPAPDARFWQQLNLGRERRRREDWNLLLWLPDREWLEEGSRAAPDLWSHRSGLFVALPVRTGLRRDERSMEVAARLVERARSLGILFCRIPRHGDRLRAVAARFEGARRCQAPLPGDIARR